MRLGLSASPVPLPSGLQEESRLAACLHMMRLEASSAVMSGVEGMLICVWIMGQLAWHGCAGAQALGCNIVRCSSEVCEH